MYQISVESVFAAAHAITIAGEREPMHGHHWHATAVIEGPELDGDGLLVDFHAVEAALGGITGRFHNRCLNEIPPFDRTNPTAELVVRHIAEELASRLVGRIPSRTRVARVSLSEAPGCIATYCMDPTRGVPERTPSR